MWGYNELELEALLNSQDNYSEIIKKIGLVKIRKLDRTISDRLKALYSYRCQICGELIGEKYGTTIIHTHHIEPFSKTMNNNLSNMMVVCPNHHGVIHSANPTFSRENKSFVYENGYSEKMSLNVHL